MKAALGAVIVVIGVIVYLSFGTLSPCGLLRESVRKQENFAAVLPDGVVDLGLALQYGALSPGRCIGILIGGHNMPTAVEVMPQQPTIPQQMSRPVRTVEDMTRIAFKEAEMAITECRDKRLSGELRTHADSTKCANPRILRAFTSANYRYMDLIAWLTEKRRQLAENIDRHGLTDEQAQAVHEELFATIVEEERLRDGARR
jgi:hypothetical protein